MSSHITDQMQSALGSEISTRVSYPVSASDVRRWAKAVYWPEPPPARYLAVDEAGLEAPEDLNPFAWAVADETRLPAAEGLSGNDPDFTEKQLGLTGPGLRFQLNGGVAVTYDRPMRVGDVITSTRVLSGYTERDGRMGTMLFTTTTDTWTNQDGDRVKSTTATLIRY